MIRSHVVVDGSNIATEGRTTPSLRQLDEAVTAFLAEHRRRDRSPSSSMPRSANRIDPSERAEFEEALLAGELVTPPAGAIGRGDAFILQIADKVDATVLSNDSFQEFHGSHPWLFDEGRLIGGKPVPGVGWVFLLRTPVRGPVSRRATARPAAKSKDRSRPTPSGPPPAAAETESGRPTVDAADGDGARAAAPTPQPATTTTVEPPLRAPEHRANLLSRLTTRCRSSSSSASTRWARSSRARSRPSPLTAPTCWPAAPAAMCLSSSWATLLHAPRATCMTVGETRTLRGALPRHTTTRDRPRARRGRKCSPRNEVGLSARSDEKPAIT